MRIVEIKAQANGGHRNQTGDVLPVPEGWAVLPDDLAAENFPFGELTARKINGVKTVTSWTPGVVPPATRPEEPAEDVVSDAEAAEAIQEGVDAV